MKKEGNGNIVSQEIQVGSFTRLRIATIGTVRIIKSNEEKVVVRTDENLQEYFVAENWGNALFVYSNTNFRNLLFTQCEITIYLRQIDTLDISNLRDVICTNMITLTNPLGVKVMGIGNTHLYIDAPSIKLVGKAKGNILIKGKCESIQIDNNSLGDLHAKELVAGELIIKNTAIGNVELYAERNISINHSGVGTVHYWGDAVLKDVRQYGAGMISYKGTLEPWNP